MPPGQQRTWNNTEYDIVAVSNLNSFLESLLIAAGQLIIAPRSSSPQYSATFPKDKLTIRTILLGCGQDNLRTVIASYLNNEKHALRVDDTAVGAVTTRNAMEKLLTANANVYFPFHYSFVIYLSDY